MKGLENAEQKTGQRFQLSDLPALRNASAVKDRHETALMSAPGVHAAGVSWSEDGKPVIKVFADTAASATGLPASIDGVAVVVEKTGPVFALNVDCEGRGLENCDEIAAEASAGSQPASPRYWHERPVPIGISVGHPDVTAGTLACRVSNGCHKYALSNAHVFADGNNGQIGDPVTQPGPIDGGIVPDDTIGYLYDAVPIIMSTSPSTRNRVDAAIISTDASTVGATTRLDGWGTPRSQTIAPAIDMNVQKYGRTTRETYAPITVINVTVDVGYGGGQTARFVDQIVIESPDPVNAPFSRYGDSGALIVVNGGTHDRKPVGLLFASTSDGIYTIANQINDVLEAFDVTIDGD